VFGGVVGEFQGFCEFLGLGFGVGGIVVGKLLDAAGLQEGTKYGCFGVLCILGKEDDFEVAIGVFGEFVNLCGCGST
jgi:hypothetical protein